MSRSNWSPRLFALIALIAMTCPIAVGQVTIERRVFSTDVVGGLQETFAPVAFYGVDSGAGGIVAYSRLESNVRSTADNIGALIVRPKGNSFLFFNRDVAPQAEPPACFVITAVYDSLSAPALGVDGDVMFRAELTGGQDRNLALYCRKNDSSVNELIVRKGDSVGQSEVYMDFQLIRENVSADIFFLADLSDRLGGDLTGQAICSDRSGGIEKLVSSGDIVVELSDIFPTYFGDPMTDENDFESIAVNDIGEMVFLSELNGVMVGTLNDQAIFKESRGDIQLVVQENDLVPEIIGARFLTLSHSIVDDHGCAVFISTIVGDDVDPSNDSAIFIEQESGLTILARESDQVPGGLSEEAFAAEAAFGNLVCNSAGAIYFSANVDSYGESFWRRSDENFEVVLREGDPAPGTSETFAKAKESEFVFQGFAVNNTEQFAVWAGLGTELSEQNDSGIWASCPNGLLQLLVREGDSVNISQDPKNPTFRTIAEVEFSTEFDSRISVSKTLSNQGLLTFQLVFTDGSVGVFSANIGEYPFELKAEAVENSIVNELPLRVFGFSDNSHDAPTINESGDVAFVAYRSLPFFDGLLLSRNQQTELACVPGLAIPNFGSGVSFSASPQVRFANLNSADENVFSSAVVGSIEGPDSIVVVRMEDQEVTELIVPNRPNETPTDRILINDSGTIVYDSLAGLFRQYKGKSPELLIGFGVPAPGLPSTTLLGVNHEAINDHGMVVFSAGLAGNVSNSAVFVVEDESITPVLSQLNVPPVTTPSYFERVIGPRVNNTGEIVALAELAGPEITLSTDDCIVRYEKNEVSLVAREGEPVPDSDGELFFGDFSFAPLAISSDGTVLFASPITGNVSNASDMAVFRSKAGTTNMVARAGHPVPGLPNHQFNGGFFRVGVNKLNQCVIADYATANSPGIAVYLTDSTGVFQKLVAADDVLDVGEPAGPPDLRRVESVEIIDSEGTENGRPTCINDNGQVALIVRFVDCSEGIFVVNTLPNFVVGDINQDGVVDLLDVQPFVDLIVNGDFQIEGDINLDGVVDILDVEPFVDILTNG